MIDAAQRVRGRIGRVADVVLPDMLSAALVRSPVAAGRIRGVDHEQAARMPGVVAVVTAADLVAAGLADVRFGTIVQDQPILAVGRVRHVGEPVAIVLATDASSARRGAAAVELDIVVDEPILDPDLAIAAGAPLVHPGRPDNILARWGFERGDLDEARTLARHRFSGRWTSPAAHVVALETHAVVAHWPTDTSLELWSTTQAPSRTTQELARVFGLAAPDVRLHVPPLGGAFGGKNHAKLEPLVAFASRIAGRPVSFVNRRSEEFVTITKHPVAVELESGVDADGRFVYRTARIVADGGAYANSSPVIPKAAGSAVLGPYRIPVGHVSAVVAYTNHAPAGSFRGLGVSQAAWASEQQVDEIAASLGLDPIEFRRRNLVSDGDRLANGDRLDDAHWLACLAAALDEAADPPGRGPDPGTTGSSRRGRGVAVVMKAMMAPFRTEVRLVLGADGMVETRASAVDMGQGARSALARITADALGLPIERITIVDPDTSTTPFDATTSSSRTVSQHHHAIDRAATQLTAELEVLAAQVSEGGLDLRYRAGRLIDTDRGASMTIEEILAAAGRDRLEADGVYVNEPPVDPESGTVALTDRWHQGAVVADVAVDTETGTLTVERLSGAAWAGRVIDPVGAARQNEGNLVYGLGPALFERLDRSAGVPLSTSLRDYRIPAFVDVPLDLRTVALESGDPAAQPDGLGESLVTAVAPAIANALAAATGVRCRDLPMTPERVLEALDAVEAARTERG